MKKKVILIESTHKKDFISVHNDYSTMTMTIEVSENMLNEAWEHIKFWLSTDTSVRMEVIK
jgi:hypothetical protein